MDPDVSAESDRREEELAVVWRAQPGPQSALISCPCYEIFFGGARGGGKTDGVLGEFAGHADKYGSLASGLMVRRQRTELVDAIERSKEIYSPLGGKYNETDKLWRFENGARLRFAYLEHDSDADAYQGHNYTRVYIEEAGNFPDSAPIFKLMATLRSANDVPVKMILTGNPGGPGQAWIRERYIDPAPLGYHLIHSEFADPWSGQTVRRERVYIPSRVKDNAYLGADYIANLQMSGSPQLVRAWLEGDFSAIVGAYFLGFSRLIIAPFKLPDYWTRFRSFDWGSARPFSVGWWAVADGTPIVYPDGSSLNLRRNELVRYREWYGSRSPNVGLELTDEEIARGIIERQASDEVFAYSVADPSIFSKRKTGTGKSTAEVMAGVGVRFRPADNNRVLGWSQVRGRMVGLDGAPMVRCFSTCLDSIRTIPLLQHDSIHPEDVDSEGEDHAADEWRYAHMSRPWASDQKQKAAVRSLQTLTMADAWKLTGAKRSSRL